LSPFPLQAYTNVFTRPFHFRCQTVEVAKQGGPFTPRDLYPFQLALYQIDSLRKEGKFEGRDGSIPEGQAILNALLSEAHEIIEMMLLEEEEGE